MSFVWDSAYDLEMRIQNTYPQVFNGNTDPVETPGDTFDSRSDNKVMRSVPEWPN